MEPKVERAMFERLQRIESRLVRGFTELGVVVCDDEDWIRVDVERLEVHMKGMGRNLQSIRLAIANAGGYSSAIYNILVNGEPVGSVRT